MYVGRFVYRTATRVAAPLGAALLATQPRHRPLLGRFRSPCDVLAGRRPLWVQACSVGEINVARPLLARLREVSAAPALLTTSTVTGWELARGVGCADEVAWFPFDVPGAVDHFFGRMNPRVLILIETELWPNVLDAARRRGVPVAIVNGRLSDRHFRRYTRAGGWFRELVGSISVAGMQDETYAQRIVGLGARPERVHVTGNLKFDGVGTERDAAGPAALRASCGWAETDPVVVFGSTRPGDEALAADCLRSLRGEFPRLRMAVAPRHLERVEEAARALGSHAVVRRSAGPGRSEHDAENPAILLIDTMGELARFYALATVAVIGGSFYPGVEGHNPIESAGLGVPTVFGPYMRNFDDARRVLLNAGGAVQATDADDLADVLRALLADGDRLGRIGERGRQAVMENRGATERTVDLLRPFLAEGEAGLPVVEDGAT